MLIFLCLTALLRKQWIENEKLAYPIIQIPLEITTNRRIFRNRLLWIGFGIAMGINLLNGLQFFFPVLPEIPVRKYNLNIYFTQKPWNAMGSMPLRFHPYLIGFSFILPLDLAFSCAFFLSNEEGATPNRKHNGNRYVTGLPIFRRTGCRGVIGTPRDCVLVCTKSLRIRVETSHPSESHENPKLKQFHIGAR